MPRIDSVSTVPGVVPAISGNGRTLGARATLPMTAATCAMASSLLQARRTLDVDTLWWVHPTQNNIEEIFEFLEERTREAEDDAEQLEAPISADVIGAGILDLMAQGRLPGMSARFLAELEQRYPHAAENGRQLAKLARDARHSTTTRPAWSEIFFQQRMSLTGALSSAYSEEILAPVSMKILHLIHAEYQDGELRYSAENGVRGVISLMNIIDTSVPDPIRHRQAIRAPGKFALQRGDKRLRQHRCGLSRRAWKHAIPTRRLEDAPWHNLRLATQKTEDQHYGKYK